MRRIVFLCLAGLLVAGAALSEDFWVKKEYMQWTDEELKKLMTNSPWAKDVTISAPPAAVGGGVPQRAAGQANGTDVESTGGGGGRGRGRGGGAANNDGGGPADVLITLNLSWRSALPMRKATVRSRLGEAAAVPPEAQQLITKDQEDYVIVVTGMPTRMARTVQNPELLKQSSLKIGKKAPIAPKGFDFQARTQSVDIIFVFPKTAPIVADDKEVEVVLKLGQVEVKKKFNLKDMIYDGKLEL
jgi:hypothetical protein